MSQETKGISVPRINKSSFEVTIMGDTSLITNCFSEEAKRKILDKQMKKARGARPIRNPEAEYNASIYRMPDGKPGFPASGIKLACINACRFLPMKMTEARGAFFVRGDIIPIDGEPEMKEDMVRLAGAGRPADLRYRAEFKEWKMTFTILHNPDIISVESIINLLETAGFHIGIGDWRPEMEGTHGMFHVIEDKSKLQ